MRISHYPFDEGQWADPGTNIDFRDTQEVEDELNQLRELYPEIKQWGDLAIFIAWGSFSQDSFSLQWQPAINRDETFLGYLYHVQQGKDIKNWSSDSAEQSYPEIF